MRQPSWLSEFSEFSIAGGWLARSGGSARSLISITSRCYCRRHCLCCRPSPLLLHPLEPVTTTQPLFNIHTPVLSLFLSRLAVFLSPSLSLMYTQGSSRQTDNTGFVMNGILLHIRRKCTLQCGFTNCLHCPKNESLHTAENGSGPGRQTER